MVVLQTRVRDLQFNKVSPLQNVYFYRKLSNGFVQLFGYLLLVYGRETILVVRTNNRSTVNSDNEDGNDYF